MKIGFGLDFGTSNSALSVCKNGEISIVKIDPLNRLGNTMCSILFFDGERNAFVGEDALIHYVDEGEEGRYMQSLKKFLPDFSFRSTDVYGQSIKLEELISIILSRIKREGERQIGKEVNEVIMGRPVFFSKDQKTDQLAQTRLLSAAQLAGFKTIHFELEPIAAALTFETLLSGNEEKIVLVGDFGGGTSDFTVMKMTGGKWKSKADRQSDILAVEGIGIGGDTFDSRIMAFKITPHFGRDAKIHFVMSSRKNDFDRMPFWIMENICQWHIIPQMRSLKNRESIRNIRRRVSFQDRHLVENLEVLIDFNYGLLLFQSIEKAKFELSKKDKARVVFDQYKLSIREKITRKEFEAVISADIEEIKKCVDSAVHQSGLEASQIDSVFLTGGSSQIPIIRNIFEAKFGGGKIRAADAFTSVAYGLGLAAIKYL